MNKGTRLIKRLMALFLVLIFSIESFGAVVSDNDGSAFITKAEFDSLKNDFQNQIDNYNTSIDSKIDGAIAAYLAGVQISKTTELKLDSKCGYEFPLVLFYNDNSWNNPASDYYIVGAPEIHLKDITFGQETTLARDNSADLSGAVMWTPDTMGTMNVGSNVPIPKTTATVPPSSTSGIVNTYMIVRNFDLAGTDGELMRITAANTTRRIGTTDYELFDLETKGHGYQIFYYNTNIKTKRSWESTAKLDGGGFSWCGVGFLGAVCYRTSGNWGTWSSREWKTDNLYLFGGHSARGTAGYIAFGPDYQQDFTCGTLPCYDGGYDTLSESINSGQTVQNNVFKWSSTNGNHLVFAGRSNALAEIEGYFGYTGNFAKGQDARLHYQGMYEKGQTYGSIYNYTNSDRNYPLYQFKYALFRPDWAAGTYSNNSAYFHRSSYASYMIRYYDTNNAEHFLDEGMFLHTFDVDATAKFTLLFGTNSGTKNVKIYVSKDPFSAANQLTKRVYFRVSGETGERDTYTMATGVSKTIEVPDIQKGQSLYLLWVPETDGEYITLDSFTDFTQISE